MLRPNSLIFFTALAAAFTSCGEPLNNDLFEDDDAYRAAIPDAEDVVLIPPERAAKSAAEACETEEGDLYRLTFNTMGFFNDVTQELLAAVQAITALPITSRTEDSRSWGPYWVEDSATYLTLTVERRAVREANTLTDRYFYWLSVAEHEEEEGDVMLWGHFDPDYTIEVGVGEITWDHSFFVDASPPRAGLATVAYDTRANRRVEASLDDLRRADEAAGEGTTITCAYEEDGEGGGWFTYENVSDIIPVSEVKEELEVTSRWLADGSGRSEGRYADGDLDLTVVSLVECWDAAACTVFYRDTHELSEPVGYPGLCSLDDVVVP